MKLKLALLLIALSFISCGKKVEHSSQEKTLSSVQAQIDKGQYESAIATLEPLLIEHPENEEIKTKLLHSYAGAGSFEALKVVGVWKKIEVQLKAYKTGSKIEAKAEVSLNVDNLLSEVDKLLEPIPELTSQQKKRLDQAIELYQEIGLKVETAGKYNNFKWGTLHIYRLAVNLKEMVSEAKSVKIDNDQVDMKAVEKAILPRLKVMGQDIFMAYKLFGNSFDKIKKITDSVDNIIAKTVGNKDFKLKVNTLAQSEGEFFKSLVEDNISAASVLIRKLGDIYVENGHQERVQDLLKTALPSEEEIKTSQKRIEALIKVFISNFMQENPDIEEKLKSIFTDELKKQLVEAAKESFKVKHTGPLKELLNSKQPEVEVLNSYYLLLKEEIKLSDIEGDIKEELENLKSKVDLELLRDELSSIAEQLKVDTKDLGTDAEALLQKNQEQLLQRKTIVEKEIKWIEEYLGDLNKGLKQSLEKEDPEQTEMKVIAEDTKNFVES